MTRALPAELLADLETAGYFPQTAAASMLASLRGARPLGYLVRPETTFDGPEVRRHLTVQVLTATHLLITHLDDDPADAPVCTMLFSRICPPPSTRSTAIDTTAAGIAVAIVSPANNQR